ncbi:MAG: ATP-binding protein [Candidatus Neomarinimicrobiota bacterium]|nr:ATP-binding protein [Candidatus Neomarinimicrobiota bacterium]|tara:strand:- start:528 stop:950 length:423 start_codon:yes stop_codon:yes gene_type:complete
MKIRDFAEVDLKIPMLPDMEIAATKTAEAMAEYLSFDQDKTDEIKLALIEATLNAFEHSKSDERFVQIKFEADNDELTIKIHDRGRGFDEKKVENPDIEKKIKSDYKRGWGMSLMEQLMDSVEVSNDEYGCTIILKKRRG